MRRFELVTDLIPCGDQPAAIDSLVDGIERGVQHQCLLGVTGSGKTFAAAQVIARVNRPALVIAPNKILAAQLYTEFKELFPGNAVEYFVSYYDYYQPEAYVPSTDTYIAKDARINEEIDRMRHSATRSLLQRDDVLIVASVSCIYGLGTAEAYCDMMVHLHAGQNVDRDHLLRSLVDIQYERNDIDFHRGTFRVRGDVVEIMPAHEEVTAIRIEWFGDEIERIAAIDPIRGRTVDELDKVAIFPNSHYVTTKERMQVALRTVGAELKERLEVLHGGGQLLEAQRLEQRTRYDLEMMQQFGHCKGIENYSRHLTGRSPGDPPPTLLDYFPDNFLLFIDESHVAVPQVGGMYRGDRSRKTTLVDHGFRLPSALDNRPLTFEEFEKRSKQVIYVSATPRDFEIDRSEGLVVEMVVRPTGLLDPEIEIRPVATQVDDLLDEIRQRVDVGERVLVTTLTKRMSEDLTEYFQELGVKVCYMHSDVETLERVAIVRDLRVGRYDVLIGINLLREGLDIPEVSLVAILDADKEGFLRSQRSLIQTFGRAARNVNGKAILYADKRTKAIEIAVGESQRRRKRQEEYNRVHGITPTTISKPITWMEGVAEKRGEDFDASAEYARWILEERLTPTQVGDRLESMRQEMVEAANKREFEHAAELRDRILAIEQVALAG